MRAFFDHYLDPMPIRARGAFQLVSVRRAADGENAVLVLPGAKADVTLVAAAFEDIERTHAALDHPGIPRVARRGEARGTPYLELACDAVVDAIELVRLLSDSDEKIPYVAADAFIAGLREALQSAHAARSPRDGGAICIGRISPGNVLYGERGSTWIVGFGRNFPVEKEDGSIDGSTSFFQAPELATGGSPSPEGDYVALLLLMRSVMPYVDMPDGVGRVLRGEIRPSDGPLIEALLWVEQNVVGQVPARRATIAEAVAMGDRIRALIGSEPDAASFAAFVARLLERNNERSHTGGRLERGEPPVDQTIILGPNAEWVASPDGQRHRLGRAQRKILLALTDRHEAGSGELLTIWDLLEAGWPGEQPIAEAGANRVYVALAHLRRLGLRDIIERTDEGYRLAARAVVRRSDGRAKIC
jgi:hypothetical protein